MVVCALLAVAGVGFGVYGMLNSNQKSNQIAQMRLEITDKDEKITNLETENLTLSEDKAKLELADQAETQVNPVIESPADEIYSLAYGSPYVPSPDGGIQRIEVVLGVKSGQISGCTVITDNIVTDQNCTVEGIAGPIYKISTAGQGQSYNGEAVAILADGTVQFIDLKQIAGSGTATARTLDVGGPVVDILEVDVHFPDQIGGYGTHVLVRTDGTYIPFGDINL